MLASESVACTSAPRVSRLTIQLTRHCNLNCFYCYCHPLKRGSVEGIRFEPLTRFVDEVLPYSAGNVVLTGGEPLIYPEIGPLLEYLSDQQQRIAIETNGVLVTPEILGPLSKTRSYVAITLESVDASIHDYIRRGPGAWDAAIHALKKIRDFESISSQITFNLTKQSQSDALDVCALGEELGVTRIKLNPIYQIGPRGRPGKKNLYLEAEEILRLAHSYGDKVANEFPFEVSLSVPPALLPQTQRYKPAHCQGCKLNSLIGVLYDGSIRPCHGFIFSDKHDLGSIYTNEYDIESILTKISELPGVRPEELKGVCRECSLASVCRGFCRAQSNSELGSTDEPNALCQELFDLKLFPNELLLSSLFGGADLND